MKKSSLVFLGLVEVQTKRTISITVHFPFPPVLTCLLITVYANSFLGSLNARSHIRNASTLSAGAFSSDRGEFSITSPRAPVVRLPVCLAYIVDLIEEPMIHQIEVTRQTVTHDDLGESYNTGDAYNLKDLKNRSLP